MNFLVINLKKYFFTILFLLFTLSLILFSESNLLAAQERTLFMGNQSAP